MKPVIIACLLPLVVAGCATPKIVKGRYVDPSGRGISGAPVTLWHESHFHKAERVAEVITDEEGRFEALPRKRAHFAKVDNHFVRIRGLPTEGLVIERGSPK